MGVFLAVVFFLAAYLANDTIKSQEDVERYLGLSTLGTIPLTDTMKSGKKSKKRKKSRGRRK